MAFVAFVVLGGLLALWWPKIVLLHLPAAAWGVVVELTGWMCPLTPLENQLRVRAGRAGYAGGFVDQYVVPVLYPEDLGRGLQLALGGGVLVANVLVYAYVLRRRVRRSARMSPASLRVFAL